jgi:hypothetical protein
LTRLVKLSKKTVSCPMAATTTMCIAIGASDHKGAVGALGSKGAACALGSKDATSVKKAAAPIQKCHVPAIGVMAEASSAESQELSPHGQVLQDSTPEFASMPKPEASLRIAHGAGGASILDFVGTIAAG